MLATSLINIVPPLHSSRTPGVITSSASDPNSANSQFFICFEPASFLDRNYTVFGKVIKGLEVIDAIARVEKDGGDRPVENVEMKVIAIK